MPTRRISFANFNRRLILAGGREQTGPAALRRASGIAPECTSSILSRWGSNLLYSGINAIQLYYWNGTRYAYDGANLYANGSIIKTGFNGSRLCFNSAPPQGGLNDYLFINGGGITPFKIDPSGNVTNWGIVAPPNAMQANNNAPDQTTIDTFDSSSTNWTPTNAAVSNNNSEYQTGTGSLEVNPSAGPWRIVNTAIAPLNLGSYSGGDISLATDVIQFWLYFNGTFNSTWLQLDFDVDDGTFKKNWYTYAIGLISANSSNPNVTVRHDVNETLSFQQNQWQLITIPKSAFIRRGEAYQYDWFNVQAIRFSGGNFTSYALLDNFVLSGGCAMGAGPAVGQGGSEYDYYVVYRNLNTGSQSNPNPAAVKVFAVQDNSVQLSQIPISSDPQVTARDLYRTQATADASPGTPYYLDTIYDNTTTSYKDVYSDESYRLATTPWEPTVAVPPNTGAPYYVDAGNGYYFKLTTNGTTGSSPPTWVIPTTEWSAISTFLLGETIAPLKANGQFWIVTTPGVSGIFQPNWAAFATPGDTITDGTVVWTNQGTKTTTDNTAVWTFQGINSTPTLSNEAIDLDNAPPQSTYGFAYFNPDDNCMYWTLDSAAYGVVYQSPPAQPESVGTQYRVSGTDDPTQALAEYDGVLWLLSNEHAWYGQGTFPSVKWVPVMGAKGTTQPFTVLRVPGVGIMYWNNDAFYILNWGVSNLIGFTQLAPIFRGQAEEDVPAWSYVNPPVWAALIKDEVLVSDGKTLTLALGYDGIPQGGVDWRIPGPVMTAAYHDEQTGEVQACWGSNIYQFEVPGVLTDGGTPIAFEMQSSGDMPDAGAEFTTQRIYLSLNAPQDQQVSPTLIVDGTELALPPLTGTGARKTFEYSNKLFGRLFDGVRLNANLTGRIEVFRIDVDVYLGEQQAAAAG